MTHEDVYIVLEKDMHFETVTVIGVYETYQLASEVMEELMDKYDEDYGYKIESKTIVKN